MGPPPSPPPCILRSPLAFPAIAGTSDSGYCKGTFIHDQRRTPSAFLFGGCKLLRLSEKRMNSVGLIKLTSCRGHCSCSVLKRSINYKGSCIQRIGTVDFNSANEFDRSHNGRHVYLQNKPLRYIAARSDVVSGGTPGAASPLSELYFGPKARGVCFYVVTATAAMLLFVLMLLAHPFVLLFDRYQRKVHHLVAKMWATLTIIPFFKVQFEGMEHLPEPNTPAVYVSNHQSFLDIYTLLTLGRCFKFISKTSIFIYPVVGWAMFLMGVIPLKRMDSRSQMDCLKRCMDLVRGGASVFFFPEGTRSKDGKLGAFKKGAFSVAAKTGVPVVPMTIMGTGNIMPAGKEGLLFPGSVKVVVHPCLVGRNAQELCDQARSVISDTLGQG